MAVLGQVQQAVYPGPRVGYLRLAVLVQEDVVGADQFGLSQPVYVFADQGLCALEGCLHLLGSVGKGSAAPGTLAGTFHITLNALVLVSVICT